MVLRLPAPGLFGYDRNFLEDLAKLGGNPIGFPESAIAL